MDARYRTEAGAVPGVSSPPRAADEVRCGPLWVSPDQMCDATVAGRRIPMSRMRLRILATLMRAGGHVVARDALYRDALDREPPPAGTRAIDVHVSRIRRALGPLGKYIVSVPGRGYRVDVAGLERAGDDAGRGETS